jgi:hypothetical protein
VPRIGIPAIVHTAPSRTRPIELILPPRFGQNSRDRRLQPSGPVVTKKSYDTILYAGSARHPSEVTVMVKTMTMGEPWIIAPSILDQ